MLGPAHSHVSHPTLTIKLALNSKPHLTALKNSFLLVDWSLQFFGLAVFTLIPLHEARDIRLHILKAALADPTPQPLFLELSRAFLQKSQRTAITSSSKATVVQNRIKAPGPTRKLKNHNLEAHDGRLKP